MLDVPTESGAPCPLLASVPGRYDALIANSPASTCLAACENVDEYFKATDLTKMGLEHPDI